jgi:hypothetical protein
MMRNRAVICVFATLVACAATATHRVSAQSGKSSPNQNPATLRFNYGGNASEIPAKFTGYLVLLPAKLNQSEPCLFELDSTAAVSSIDPSRAGELGLDKLHDPVLNFSGVDISLPVLAQATKPDFNAQVGRVYEGTIGQDIFQNAVIEIDYSRQTVRFYDPATYQYSGKGKTFHVNFISGVPVMKAKFSVTGGKSFEGDFAVDTAADASLVVYQRFNQQHHVLHSHVKTIRAGNLQLGGENDAVLARLTDVNLGPLSLAEPVGAFPRVDASTNGDNRLAGEIGGGILRRFTVVFDFSRQQIILDPNSNFNSDDVADMSGLSISAGGPNLRKFEVTAVQPGSPGAEGKIQPGDVIAGIDDEAAADMTLEDVRNLFRQVGHKYKLLIERNGQTRTVAIQMRRMI